MRENGRHTPLIAVGDRLDSTHRQPIVKAGANGFLAKPFDVPDMIATVRRYLSIDVESTAEEELAGDENENKRRNTLDKPDGRSEACFCGGRLRLPRSTNWGIAKTCTETGIASCGRMERCDFKWQCGAETETGFTQLWSDWNRSSVRPATPKRRVASSSRRAKKREIPKMVRFLIVDDDCTCRELLAILPRPLWRSAIWRMMGPRGGGCLPDGARQRTAL